MVRKRAGIPDLESINPAIKSNKDLQRKAIQRESRIELATEGQRYFDVRRWMICERPDGRQGGDFFGMDMNGNATTFFRGLNSKIGYSSASFIFTLYHL